MTVAALPAAAGAAGGAGAAGAGTAGTAGSAAGAGTAGRTAAGRAGGGRAGGGGRGNAARDAAGGAAGGSMLGGRSGKKGKRRKATGPQRALLAELVVCLIVLGLSPLSRKEEQDPADWMRQGSAIMGVYMVLGLLSAVGPRTGRAAAAFGALVALVLLIDQRALWRTLAKTFAVKTAAADDGEGLETPSSPTNPGGASGGRLPGGGPLGNGIIRIVR